MTKLEDLVCGIQKKYPKKIKVKAKAYNNKIVRLTKKLA
jgi:hypothetical protein